MLYFILLLALQHRSPWHLSICFY